MRDIKNFNDLVALLKERKQRKRVAVVCGYDPSTQQSVMKALESEIIDAIFVGRREEVEKIEGLSNYADHISFVEADDLDDAARQAVTLVRENKADILMKGLIGSDKVLRAVLNKEYGILNRPAVLTHVAMTMIDGIDRPIFYTDAAVIPFPTQEQREQQVKYLANICHAIGIEEPRISLIHCSEKADAKNFPYTEGYEVIINKAQNGEYGRCIVGGPLDVKTSLCRESMLNKGIKSPIDGKADVLIFPNIEAANTFHKTITLFCHANVACILQGTTAPVVLPSRSDDAISKFYSLAFAALTVK